MAIFKFKEFVFDSESYRLEQNGEPIEMRPKALKLLSLLIENRERIVSKTEIFSFVWGQAYTRDHLLFQLVSELRKAPFEAEFVRTQPNEGYRWNVPTRIDEEKRTLKPYQLAAGLLLGFVLMTSSSFVAERHEHQLKASLLPAQSALTRGVIAMESGEAKQAIKWFKFALRENPESVETSLLLAETLLLNNKLEESSQQLNALLLKPDLNSYSAMVANDVLSRIHQRQGSLNTALKFSLRSGKEQGIAQCTAEVVKQRVHGLASQLGFSKIPETTEVASAGANTELGKNQTAPVSQSYSDQCGQLMEDSDETSFCPPEPFEMYAYLNKVEHLLS